MPPVPPAASADPLAAAFRYYERRQELLAHNLANVDTVAFKGERAFARVLGAASQVAGGGAADAAVPVLEAATDLRQGPLQDTGAPLDLALSGPGFFVVSTPQGERWTRGGSFELDATGRVLDATGAPLLGADGPATVPAGTRQITIDPAGRVLADGRPVAALRLEQPVGGPTQPTQLAHEGGGHLVPSMGRATATGTMVRQGMLEGSNVNTVATMVDMISVQRAYAMLGQAHSVREAVDDRAPELGKPV